MRGVYSATKALIAILAISFAVPSAQAEEISHAPPEEMVPAAKPVPAPAITSAPLLPPSTAVIAPAAPSVPAAPIAAGASAQAVYPDPVGYGPLVLPPKMLSRVKFWVDVYAHTFSWEYRVHDVKHPELVYSVFSVKGKPKGALAAEKARVLAILRSLSAKMPAVQSGKLGRAKLKPEENRLLSVFERENMLPELTMAATAKRVHAQAGLRDGLEDSMFVSGRYLPRMQKLFMDFDLPAEIAYLPFVESGFNKKAVSKVGASGIWQFMPYTGKLYLRVDDVVDERNDPMRAGEAAARLMKQNHAMLDEWPLAITGYNHGPMGVARAVREVGSRDLGEIIEKYDGKSFGYASQNFYASFLAAVHVAKHSDLFLGIIPRARKLEFDEFIMPNYMDVHSFITLMGIDEPMFRELNMALTKEVYDSNKYIPVGYTVRVPTEFRDDFLRRYQAIPAQYKFAKQKGAEIYGPPAPSASKLPSEDPDLVR